MLDSRSPERTSLAELGRLFLKLGTVAFGGPAAHVAMMREEVVVRRGWMSEERFLDLYGATNLIPGPNSTELAIHIGFERRRWMGLVVAGVAFILPAMLITGTLGFLYVRYGHVPSAQWLLHGVKPVILGIVSKAILGLAPHAARDTRLRVLGMLAVVASFLGVDEIALLFGVGMASVLIALPRKEALPIALPFPPMISTSTVLATSAIGMAGIFWSFAKIGSVLFGSGYVLLAFLRAEFVERLGWIDESQLIDAVAVGQVTPGPVFTTATFLGYVLDGPSGALAATAGIFLPAFVFVALSGPLVPRLRASPIAGRFLDGVNVASLALMVVVTWQLAGAALVDSATWMIGILSAIYLVRWRVNPTWLIAGGALAGYAVHAIPWA